ncbi:transmembrane protein, putative (macronuclear) [Tetrahymena thermophila SB210]|uniref:Transmembrane protein, putative n=1 Tax=Tetrahymena thermophila (strain SB210) TaxID=312017 RepID=W7XDY0_TETTS|nr:transmembrane protein, putative [Tetrahymena thermophila SB210]EWS75807.1 transmembrane protein, putative [Tetrahymena thermophila SB210]|eukprot:XP_012651729.1 transmembrane protein, putative [Tetrahymena thermophila SB210]
MLNQLKNYFQYYIHQKFQQQLDLLQKQRRICFCQELQYLQIKQKKEVEKTNRSNSKLKMTQRKNINQQSEQFINDAYSQQQINDKSCQKQLFQSRNTNVKNGLPGDNSIIHSYVDAAEHQINTEQLTIVQASNEKTQEFKEDMYLDLQNINQEIDHSDVSYYNYDQSKWFSQYYVYISMIYFILIFTFLSIFSIFIFKNTFQIKQIYQKKLIAVCKSMKQMAYA